MFVVASVAPQLGCGSPPVAPSESQPSAPLTTAPYPPEVSASPQETRPCDGPTAITPEVDRILSTLESPERSHCEVHAPGPGEPALLFVRTMNTVAHDDDGRKSPACTWEVFRTAGANAAHVTTLSSCMLRFEARCIRSLDDGSSDEPIFCFDPK
jgi:hypothetical protein